MQLRVSLRIACLLLGSAAVHAAPLPIRLDPRQISDETLPATVRRQTTNDVHMPIEVIYARDDQPATLQIREAQIVQSYYPNPGYTGYGPTPVAATPSPTLGASGSGTAPPQEPRRGLLRTVYSNGRPYFQQYGKNFVSNGRSLVQYTGTGFVNMGKGIGNYAKKEAQDTATGFKHWGQTMWAGIW